MTLKQTTLYKMNDIHQKEVMLLDALGDEFASIIYVDLKQHTFEWMKRQNVLMDEYYKGTLQDLKKKLQEYLKNYVHPEDTEIRNIIGEVFAASSVEVPKRRYQTIYRHRNMNRYEWMQLNVIFGTQTAGDSGHMILAFKSEDARIRKELTLNRMMDDVLERTEKTETARREFQSRMFQDMRAPLNTVLEVLERVKDTGLEGVVSPEDARAVEEAGSHLHTLMTHVLNVNVSENGSRALKEGDFDLLNLVHQVVDALRPEIKERKQKITVDLSRVNHNQVYSDKGALGEILTNLLSNASRYSLDGADLSVTVMELPKLRTGYAHYSFAVMDTGIGIAQDKIDEIFKPFERMMSINTNDCSHIGLGLTITKSLVDLLRGEITVNSVLGEGSCFTVTLEMKIREEIVFDHRKSVDFDGMKVLLVVDNAVSLKILRKLLVTENVFVEEVMNGQEAVSAFAVKDKGYYDLILMDVQFPMMNGYAATKQIRSMVEHGGDEVPIIAVTADALAEDVQLAMQAGMNGHLKKPVNFAEMRAMLASIRK